MKQYASDLQTFLGMNEIEVKVYENEQYLQSMKDAQSLERIDLVWMVDPFLKTILNSLMNFGSIEVKTQAINIEFIRAKDKQAQLHIATTKKTIHDVKLILQRKITTVTTDITDIRGCCISEEGDILYTDYQIKNASLTVIASDNKPKNKMSLYPSWGFDLTLIDGNSVAITTGGSRVNMGVDIIDIKNRSIQKFISLPGYPFGITRNHDSLFVCVKNHGIYKINISDFTVSHVIICDLPYRSYVSVFTDNIYYTNYDDHSVVCCDCNGSRVWSFEDKDEWVLNRPVGIAVDNNGNLYVGEKSSNVVIISNDGKQYKQILTENDGLLFPSGIFFDKENNKLIVSNASNTAFVYNIS